MKNIKRLLALMLLLSFLLSAVGCYFISGQRMRNVKGTYKLTHYTYTPKYERREGYTPKTTDYINDEEYKYEVYLVVTGTGTGYYVHKDAGGNAYVKEVTLRYEYSSDDSSKVEYVIFNDAISVNKDDGFNRLGVAKNNLNYTKNAIDYTELFTKRPMRSEALSVRWEKVSRDTDLSYAEEQVGALKKYDYLSFGARGIFELGSAWDIATGEVKENPYQYFFYVIDTADNAVSATAYYALAESPTEQVVSKVSVEKGNDGWNLITIDGTAWTLDQSVKGYYNETDGVRSTLNRVSSDLSDKSIQSLVEGRIPTE